MTASDAVRFALTDVAPIGAGPPPVGRYRRPLVAVNLAEHVSRFRLKEWCYQAIVSDEVLVAFAVAQLGYVAQAFVYLVDRRTGRRVSVEKMSPLGTALSMAPSSIAGSTRWQSQGLSLVTGFEAEGVHTRFSTELSGERCEASFHFALDDALALVFPLSASRTAYTHKAAGMRALGSLTLGARTFCFDTANHSLATLDWTRSVALRHTRWNWASFVGHTERGQRFGLNLSAHVYDDARGDSVENAVWVDGKVHTLSGVRFEVPRPTTEAWRIVSRDGSGEVDLMVLPVGERRSETDLKLLRSTFVQPYGEASGQVRGERVRGLMGVVEEHDALW